MFVVLILVALGLAAVCFVLLRRKQNRPRSSGRTYFTQTLGVDNPAPQATKDEPPVA